MSTEGGGVNRDYEASSCSFAFSIFSTSSSFFFVLSRLCNVNREGDVCVRKEAMVTEINAKVTKINRGWCAE